MAKRLGASFFCSRQTQTSRLRKYIIPTIVSQLALHSLSFAKVLLDANVSTIDDSTKQMQEVLLTPWKKSADALPDEILPYLIVIDALDEIDDRGGLAFLRELVKAVDSDGSDLRGLKFLVTSRPDRGIKDLCQTLPSESCHLEDVAQESVQDDIHLYLCQELEDLTRSPPDVRLRSLAKLSGGLFIYAATAVRYIRGPSTNKYSESEQSVLLDSILREWPSREQYGDDPLLDQMYVQIVQEPLLSISSHIRASRVEVLHTILCAQEPLPASAIVELLGMDKDKSIVEKVVDGLRAVLSHSNGRVSFYHKSFVDFLFEKNRSGSLRSTRGDQLVSLTCDPAAQHVKLADHCFRVLDKSLRFNICELPSSFLPDDKVPNLDQRIEKNISIPLRYAARYWADHLLYTEQDEKREALQKSINDFCSLKVLFWVEAMNLLGFKTECYSSIVKAQDWVSRVTMPYFIVFQSN